MSFNIKDEMNDEILAEINITPLTDIFLVLLIIFMISSSAMLESGLSVKLPVAKSSNLTHGEDEKPIYVTISNSGDILLNSRKVTLSELPPALTLLVKQSKGKRVVIRADSSIVFGKAVTVMDIAKASGAEKIAIATQPPGK